MEYLIKEVNRYKKYSPESLTVITFKDGGMYASSIESIINKEIEDKCKEDSYLEYFIRHYFLNRIEESANIWITDKLSRTTEHWSPIDRWVFSPEHCESRRIVGLKYTIKTVKRSDYNHHGVIRDFHTGELLYITHATARTVPEMQRIIDEIFAINFK